MNDLMKWMYDRRTLSRIVIVVNFLVTTVTYITYPLMVLKLFLDKNPLIYPFVFLPMFMFIIVSLFRHIYDAKRPYEVYFYEPILSKESKGKSFPSRHVFSIFVIAMAYFNISYWLGLVFIILGVLLAICRVLGGVHFVRDVVMGALCGIIPWIIFWAL